PSSGETETRGILGLASQPTRHNRSFGNEDNPPEFGENSLCYSGSQGNGTYVSPLTALFGHKDVKMHSLYPSYPEHLNSESADGTHMQTELMPGNGQTAKEEMTQITVGGGQYCGCYLVNTSIFQAPLSFSLFHMASSPLERPSGDQYYPQDKPTAFTNLKSSCRILRSAQRLEKSPWLKLEDRMVQKQAHWMGETVA
ncbi:hypothetical protein STEG23_032370, partial [Scotinomys teguina]